MSSTGRIVGRYLIALPTVAAAVGVTYATWPLCRMSPWAFSFGAVMATGWLGGFGPCVLATALSAVAGTYLFFPPYNSFEVGPHELGSVLVFATVSTFIGLCAAARFAFEERERGLRRRFEAMAKSLGDAILTADAEGRAAFLNPAAERLTGWSRAQARGLPLGDVLALRPGPGDAGDLPLPKADEAGPREFRGLLQARDGEARPVEGSVAPIRDGSRRVGAVFCFRDVGERLRAEAALHESEELNRKLVDGSVDLLEMLDLEGRLLSMNDHGRRLMEVEDVGPLLGRDWASTWPETMRGEAERAVRRAAAGERVRFEGPCPTSRGAEKEWEVDLAPILAADGSPERVYVIRRDVTDRRRDQRELLAGEARYRTLFESIDEGFCVIEMIYDESGEPVDYVFLETNPAFEAHTGLVGAKGRRMRELVPGHDEHWFRTYGRVVATRTPIRFVETAEKMGGGWFDLYALPLEGPKVAVLFKNVTEKVRAERERERLLQDLDAERARLASVIQDAPAFICSLRGPDHVFELANRRYVEMTGGRDLIGKTAREAFPDLEGQGFFELLDQVYRTGEPYFGKEMPIRFGSGPDAPEEGEVRTLNFVYQAMRDPAGGVSGIFVHGVDVSEAVSAREAVRESEARFRQLADAMPQSVWSARADGVIDYFNRKWREYGSYPEGVLGDARWARLIHPDDRERAHAAWLESLRSGRPFEIEYRLRRAADGAYRWHLGRALPVEDSRARIVRWFGTNTDVDDVKRLSEALKQADRRKDEFLATLAHELRGPLAPLRNGLQILRLGGEEAVAAGTLDMMSRQVGHMVTLIDDLMDVARVGSGKLSLRKRPVTLQAAAAAAVESVRQAAEAAGHSLTVSLPDEPLPLDADPTRLNQVLANLLGNAAKYTEPGGRIGLEARREGGEAVVVVRDTGVGIAPEMLPRIFEMFTQVDGSLDRSQGGLGIGLTIVKRLVELHGGRIEARSAGVGRGSEFVVRLPLAGGVEAEAEAPVGGDEQGAAGAIRVLVVDDNRDSANSLSRLLALDGHDVHTAYEGGQALAEAAAFPPDVILLDLGLPDRNGFEVAAELRASADFRDTMIVALTGWGQPEDRRRSREAGFDHHLVKPVEIDALRSIIAAVAEADRGGRGDAVAAREG